MKKVHFFKAMGAYMLLLLAAACKRNLHVGANHTSEKDKARTEASSSGIDTGLVVLGKKLDNPYSLENMRKAFSKARSVEFREELKPTHLYVRFLPKNSEELSLLYLDTTLIYSSIPVGYEIEKEGNYYHDPNIPKGQITWLYATVSPDYKFPNIQYEIVEKLYKPEDDDIEVISLALTGNLGDKEMETKVRAANTVADMGSLMWFWGSRKYHPSGHIYVIDNSDKNNRKLPLRRAKVYVQYWFWNNTAFTDNNGYYRIGERYSKEVGIYLENRDGLATISGHWNEYAGIMVSDKLTNGRDNVHHVIQPHEDHIWKKATVHNAIALYDDFARKNGMARPNNVRTWVGVIDRGNGMAPMLNGRFFTEYMTHIQTNRIKNAYGGLAINDETLAGYMVFIVGGVALDAITLLNKHLLPDIMIGKQDNTKDYYAIVCHEMSHYSHFHKAGLAWWTSVIYETLINSFESGFKNPYGDGTKDFSGNRLALAESWAPFIEDYATFKEDESLSKYKDKYENKHEEFNTPEVKSHNAPSKDWRPSKHLFNDLVDSYENIVILLDGNGTEIKKGKDQVSGIPVSVIYDMLNRGTNSLEDLKAKLIARYPEKNKNNEITLLFSYYGY